MQHKVFIFSAPSGSGKTTVVKHLVKVFPELSFSVSACTRNKRPNEIHGVDYYFLSEQEFRDKIHAGAFLEYEEVYPGSLYGTLKSEVERLWALNKHVIFDVDVVGGLNIKKYFGPQALSIFVQPPSLDVLIQRLTDRSTESKDKMEERIRKAKEEFQFAPQFDRILLNDQLENTLVEAEQIIKDFLQS